MNLVAFSGGKDSTALALRLAETGETFTLLFTPTGDELPGVAEYVERIQRMTGMPLVTPPGPTLAKVIETQGILPNHRMRWCTRMCKIEPCIAYLRQHPGSTLAVGLRADEEERTGLYGEHATYRYPLREWGWGLREVKDYLRCRGVKIPWRTNCAVCFWARADEQWRTWREYPEMWARGERWEAETGHTFRWGVSMREKREWFERGGRPRKIMRSLPLFPESDEEIGECRVCSL